MSKATSHTTSHTRAAGHTPGDKPGSDSPWTYTPVKPLTVATSSSLTEDWIRTQDVLVLPDDSFERSTVAAYRQNRTAPSEALVVGPDSRLYQVTPDQTTESGWAVRQLATSGQVGEVVAGPNALDPATAHAFYATGSNMVHLTRKAGGGWTPTNDKLPTCSGLRYTSPPSGELIAYGVNADGDLQIVRRAGGGGWQASTVSVGVPLSVGTTMLQMVDDSSWSLATKDDKTGGLILFRGTTTPIGDPVHVPPPTGASFSKILFAFSRANAVMFLVADDQGRVYTVDFLRNVVPVPGAQAAQGTAVLDAAGLLHFYGVATDGTLSALHQQQWTSSGPSWVSAIPVDQGIVKVVTDGYPRHGAALFAVDATNRLRFYSQDQVTAAWTPARVQRPADADPYNLPQYRTEITVVDDLGNPAPNVELTVGATSACTVSVGSQSYPVSKSLTTTVKTNVMGKAQVATPAFSLHVPALQVTAPGLLHQPVSITADQEVHNYLAGTGSLNGSPPLTAESLSSKLQNDKIGKDQEPLSTAAPGNPALADAAAQGIMHSFGTVASTSAAAMLRDQGIVGWSLDLRDLSNPSFTTFTSLDELQAHREAVYGEELLGGIWDDIKGFAQDVWEGIKRAAITVVHWTVDLVHNTIDQITDELGTLAKMVIDGIDKAIAVVHSICNKIGAFVGKVVQWLQAFFSWDDIWETKNGFLHYLTPVIGYLQDLIDKRAVEPAANYFQNQKDTIKAKFAGLTLDKGETFQSLVDKAKHPPAEDLIQAGPRLLSARPLLAGPAGAVNGTDYTANNRNNWLLDKLQTYFHDQPLQVSQEVQKALQDALTELDSKFAEAWGRVKDTINKAFDNFRTAITDLLGDVKNIAQKGLQVFLDATLALILAGLEFADLVVEGFLKVVNVALGGIKALFETPLQPIPLVTPTLQKVAPAGQGSGLTIADLLCLVIAVPLTLTYKLTHGADAKLFPGGKLPEDEDKAKTAARYCAVGVIAIWALFDTALDAFPEVELLLFKIMDIVFPTLAQVFTWPGGIPFAPDPPLDDPGAQANFSNWAVGWAPILLSIALLVAPALPWAPERKQTVARSVDPLGKIILTALGGAAIVTGIAASVENPHDAGGIAVNVLGPLANLTQVLRLESVLGASGGVTGPIKLAVDFFTGEGTAIALSAAE